MEPISVLVATNAALGITRSLVHTIRELYELAEAYETAALGIRTVATQCNSFRVAVQRIHNWLTKQDESARYTVDEDFWAALVSNLETSRMVLDDLEKRIQGLKKNPAKFWTRTKYLWDSTVISELQTQIQGLMSALSILIQVIDIPSTGSKRSASAAQKKRLNGLTVSVRKKANDQRCILIEAQGQGILDSLDQEQKLTSTRSLSEKVSVSQCRSDDLPSSAQNATSEKQWEASHNQASYPNAAPPPYQATENNTQAPATKDTKKNGSRFFSRTRSKELESNVDASPGSFKVLNTTDSQSPPLTEEPRAKKSFWRNIGKRSGTPKDEQACGTSSLHETLSNQSAGDKATSPLVSPRATPIALENELQVGYFDLQHRNGAPSSTGGVTEVASASATRINTQNSDSTNMSSTRTDYGSGFPAIMTPPENYSSAQQNCFAARSKSSSNSATIFNATPPNAPERTESSDSFDRIRPSQRVRNAQERSLSQDRLTYSLSPLQSRDTLDRTLSHTASRLSSIDFLGRSARSPDLECNVMQNWQTLGPLSTRPVKILIHFEPASFVNKISSAAHRALGLPDAMYPETTYGQPTTDITLLHTVTNMSGMTSSEDDSNVSGCEGEFVLLDRIDMQEQYQMSNHKLLIVLGAEFAHLAQVMEGGEYVYWNPGYVPERLRTKEQLRMWRRFELVRW